MNNKKVEIKTVRYQMSHYPHFHTHYSVTVTVFVDCDMND